jgi:hypothetical protein
VTATIFVEGGGDSKDLHILCRKGFRRLLENCTFSRRMPRLRSCGGRAAAYEDFKIGHQAKRSGDYVALLVDSEDPVADIEATWPHLMARDGWQRPEGAENEQVLLMATCMETWIVSDRETLAQHYGSKLQGSALPPLMDLENRAREIVQESLAKATRKCRNAYAKGKRSFEIMARLVPNTLAKHLPCFIRFRRVLKKNL